MKPVDFRNETWTNLQGRVVGLRLETYLALLACGPCTTRELARQSGIDILTVRPRVTELCQIGFAVLVNEAAAGHEGEYRALPSEEVRAVFEHRRAGAAETRVQAELALS